MTTDERVLALLGALATVPEERRVRVLKRLPRPIARAFEEQWAWQAHGGQREPPGDWRVWLMMAGRGFGKTRAGAEWVWARAREAPDARIALVGASLDEVAKVMVGGPSGLLAVARTDERPRWIPTRGLLRFPSGATAHAYSGEKPDKLRGPEHDFAWCDEIAKWARPDETWDNLQLTMRRGERPRLVVTTTPKALPLLTRIIGLDRTERTGGGTADNLHTPEDYRSVMAATYGGTRLGRQELEGLLIEDVEGSLWPRTMIELWRVPPIAPGSQLLKRVVLGVDPPASAGGDACGIVVCGMDADERLYVLADHSVAGLRPEGWAQAVARAAELWNADRVVAESNQGGEMVESVLRSAEHRLPVRAAYARRGKSARAEPVATRFEAGWAHFAGRFPELEDELCAMIRGGAYRGAGSPDRADAMVWAMSELLATPRAEPRIRLL